MSAVATSVTFGETANLGKVGGPDESCSVQPSWSSSLSTTETLQNTAPTDTPIAPQRIYPDDPRTAALVKLVETMPLKNLTNNLARTLEQASLVARASIIIINLSRNTQSAESTQKHLNNFTKRGVAQTPISKDNWWPPTEEELKTQSNITESLLKNSIVRLERGADKIRRELEEIQDKLGNKRLFHPSSASQLPDLALQLHRHTSFLREQLFEEIKEKLSEIPGRSGIYTDEEIINAINYLASRSSEPQFRGPSSDEIKNGSKA